MARQMLNKTGFHTELHNLERSGRKFLVERCGNSSKIKFAGQEYYYYSAEKLNKFTGKTEPNKMPISQVHFINVVKQYIVKHNIHETTKPNYRNITDIHFIGWNKKVIEGSRFDDCHCVDISKAYWTSALMQKFINKELYEKGLLVDKRICLACLGTFAKVKYIWECGGNIDNLIDIIEPQHPHIFFNCANHIYRVMAECQKAAGKDFLFFWTDCINVRTEEALRKCEAIIKKNGFGFHSQNLDYVKFESNKILVGGKGFELIAGEKVKKIKKYNIDIAGNDDTILERLKKEIKRNKLNKLMSK